MILMNDFTAEPQELREAMLVATRRVLDSGWYVLGKEVRAFEKQWSDRCGVAHGVAVANGMDALEIALRSLQIGPGDEVITTPMTAFATVLSIIRAGATPVLADIEPESALLSPDSVQRCISHRTKAVMLVHLYGQVRDMAKWVALCASNSLHLIEDCAQAHLAALGGKVAGSFGIAGAYSFYPTKNLGAAGDAGMLITADKAIAVRAASLRNYGQSERYHHPILGLNSRLDEIHAAMLIERFRWLHGFTERRRIIADAYRQEIRNPLVRLLAAPQEPAAHVYHLFAIACAQRAALQLFLQDRGIQALIHYPIPVHEQEPCRQLRRDPLGLSYAETYAGSCLSIPCHPQMTDDDVAQVISAVNDFT
jgi:dTDP-4-amino-4,6-dideoxygalactose transaminase